MKMPQCLMDEVTVDLTCMASLSIGDGVRDHLQPIIAKSSKPVFELGSGLVSSAYNDMSFFERLPCLYVKGTGVEFHHTIGDTIFA